MHYSSNDKYGAQARLGLSAPFLSSSSSLSSLIGRSLSRPFAKSVNKTCTVIPLIKSKPSVSRQGRLRRTGLLKGSDLRARFKGRRANSEGEGRPVISAPFVELQRYPMTNTNNPICENRQPASQPSIQHSKLAKRHEALGSHPVHIPRGDGYSDIDSTFCESDISDDKVPYHCGTQKEPHEGKKASRDQLRLDNPRETQCSSPDDTCSAQVDSSRRQEQERQVKTKTDLEGQIGEATVAANMYFCQAHSWEAQSPVPKDLDSLPEVLRGLYAIMIRMHHRIQEYESTEPKIRKQYEDKRGLS